MEALRYGVIGARSRGISSEHVRSILRLPDARLAGVCNHDEGALSEVERVVPDDVNCYGDYKTMLAEEALDVVVVATPNFTHESIAVDAFGAKAHVLCEKPLARTVPECDTIIAAANEAGRLLQVGFHRRYNRIYRRLRNIIDRGELGRPCLMSAEVFRGDWGDRQYDDPVRGSINWRHDQLLSGGSLVEKNCHDFDMFNMVANSRPTRVMASGGVACYEGRETLDHAVVIVEYENGFKANLQFSLFVPHQGVGGRRVAVIGDEGIVKIYEKNRELYQYFKDSPDEIRFVDRSSANDYGVHGEGVYLQHIDFASCIRNHTVPSANGESARSAIAIAVAAEDAVRTGEVVEISERS